MGGNTLASRVAIIDCTVSGGQKNRGGVAEMSPFMG